MPHLSRRNLLTTTLATCATSLLAACGTKDATTTATGGATAPDSASALMYAATLTPGQFSNLAGQASRQAVAAVLADAGVAQDRVAVVMEHADQLIQAVGTDGLADDFRSLSEAPATYDAYAMQDAWNAKQPDFPGYNCRITTYTLAGHTITVEGGSAPEHTDYDALFMDHSALEADSTATPTAQDRTRFDALYTAVATQESQDTAVHVKAVQDAWAARGVTFQDAGRLSVVSVLVYSLIDRAELMVGHTGVLVEREDGTLLFVEKLAFQEPYQVTVLQDRQALNDMLMGRYDVPADSTDAPAMVLEGSELIEGYRRVNG